MNIMLYLLNNVSENIGTLSVLVFAIAYDLRVKRESA